MMYAASLNKSAQLMTAGLFLAGIAMMLISTSSHAAGASTDVSDPVTRLSATQVQAEQVRQRTLPARYNPLLHTFASGLRIRGIRLSESLFLTQVKEEDGHKSVGVSLKAGEYLYQLGTEQLTVSFLF